MHVWRTHCSILLYVVLQAVFVLQNLLLISFFTVKSPAIIDQPDSLQLVVPKQPVTFTVNATGDNLMYEWKMDGIAICGAKTATYTIETVSESDEGMYWCVVSNAADSITSTAASLTVCKCCLPHTL